MKLTPHDDCRVCEYWIARAREEELRAMAGDESAYRREQNAWCELESHLERSAVDAANTANDGMLEVRTHPQSHDVALGPAGDAASTLSALLGRVEIGKGRGDGVQQ